MYARRKHFQGLRGELAAALREGRVFESKIDGDGSPVPVPAILIRDLLRGGNCGNPDPRGLRLRRVPIQGRLDLDHLRTNIKLELHECELPEGLTAKHADLAEVAIINLKECGYCADAPFLDFSNARLETLDLSGTSLLNPRGQVLNARGVNIRADARLEFFKSEGRADAGAVRFAGATIGGQLVMNSAALVGLNGPALNLGGIRVENGAYFKKFSAQGEVRMPGADIGGTFVMRDAVLNCFEGPALFAARIKVDTNLYFENSTAKGNGLHGTLCFLGATIGGHLHMEKAVLKSSEGGALNLSGATIGNNAYLKSNFNASGSGDVGTVRLPGATIGGHLSMNRAILSNSNGPALIADGLEVGGNALFKQGFQAGGNGELGVVRLSGVVIRRQLVFHDAEIISASGPALVADRIKVDNGTSFHGSFITSHSEAGALTLIGASLAGNLKFRMPIIKNDNGPALVASSLTVDADLELEVDSKHYDVDFQNTTVWGQFLYMPQAVPSISQDREPTPLWNLAGFTYGTLGSVEQQRTWLRFLESGHSEYTPHAYQQFVAVAVREGHEDLARKAAIMRHNDLLQRSKRDPNLLSGEAKLARLLLKYTVGHGYLPWLAWGWLLFFFLLYFSILLLASGIGLPWQAMETVGGAQCDPYQLWLLAWEVVPLMDSLDTRCSPVAWRGPLAVAQTLCGLGAWAAVTLFVVGFTSIIRRPGQ